MNPGAGISIHKSLLNWLFPIDNVTGWPRVEMVFHHTKSFHVPLRPCSCGAIIIGDDFFVCNYRGGYPPVNSFLYAISFTSRSKDIFLLPERNVYPQVSVLNFFGAFAINLDGKLFVSY